MNGIKYIKYQYCTIGNFPIEWTESTVVAEDALMATVAFQQFLKLPL